MPSNNAFAEIIESSLACWSAQTWQWNESVPFGSLVAIEEDSHTLFGIVHQVNTGSCDPSRTPFTYQKTHAELHAEQPQIFEFLKTTVSCVCAGYQEGKRIFYLLPPQPPRIHSFVRPADHKERVKFFESDQFLHLLFSLSTQIFNLDELLLALIKQLTTKATHHDERFIRALRTYSLLAGNDYRRLKLFLQRAQQLTTNS